MNIAKDRPWLGSSPYPHLTHFIHYHKRKVRRHAIVSCSDMWKNIPKESIPNPSFSVQSAPATTAGSSFYSRRHQRRCSHRWGRSGATAVVRGYFYQPHSPPPEPPHLQALLPSWLWIRPGCREKEMRSALEIGPKNVSNRQQYPELVGNLVQAYLETLVGNLIWKPFGDPTQSGRLPQPASEPFAVAKDPKLSVLGGKTQCKVSTGGEDPAVWSSKEHPRPVLLLTTSNKPTKHPTSQHLMFGATRIGKGDILQKQSSLRSHRRDAFVKGEVRLAGPKAVNHPKHPIQQLSFDQYSF